MAVDTIITIGRQAGSGGREIGRLVADILGIPFYDKELLERAAEESGFSKEFFMKHDEKRTSSFIYSLAMDSPSPGFSAAIPGMPINHRFFLAQFNTIKTIAKEGGCVIVGRCADYALEENPHLLSIFIHADYEFRVKRCMQELSIDEYKARELINKTDKQRASYYNYYTGRKWGVATNYEIALKSSVFGVEETARFIASMARIKAAVDHGDPEKTEDVA